MRADVGIRPYKQERGPRGGGGERFLRTIPQSLRDSSLCWGEPLSLSQLKLTAPSQREPHFRSKALRRGSRLEGESWVENVGADAHIRPRGWLMGNGGGTFVGIIPYKQERESGLENETWVDSAPPSVREVAKSLILTEGEKVGE